MVVRSVGVLIPMGDIVSLYHGPEFIQLNYLFNTTFLQSVLKTFPDRKFELISPDGNTSEGEPFVVSLKVVPDETPDCFCEPLVV